ncbi:hypothetical protein DMNBHIDG_00237 [Candidatus Methanoperedenaceae archaeon GB37]|nr:hypothetical protein DMNBHIDG_00237 [Candidatus Methanoperedenaceae archaeon GB37]
MSYAYENLTNNLVYHMLMTAINGMQIFGLIHTQEEQKEIKICKMFVFLAIVKSGT